MKTKKIKRFVVEWLLLTGASLLLLWWILGKNDVGGEEGLPDIVVFDVAYCAVLSLCVMMVCTAFVRLLADSLSSHRDAINNQIFQALILPKAC